jgi:hypothetical protein
MSRKTFLDLRGKKINIEGNKARTLKSGCSARIPKTRRLLLPQISGKTFYVTYNPSSWPQLTDTFASGI